jgi:hypothetical protein
MLRPSAAKALSESRQQICHEAEGSQASADGSQLQPARAMTDERQGRTDDEEENA